MNRSGFVAGLFMACIAGTASAQAPVSGIVHDSLARRPLAGAAVQVVSADGSGKFTRTVSTDSLGRFSLTDVPNGRYLVGFLHPSLDSVGLEPPLRELIVTGTLPVRFDLATPSPARMHSAICGNKPLMREAADSGSLVVGTVRDARSLDVVQGATISAEWLEMTFSAQGVQRRVPKITATSGANGWYALCDLPAPGIASIRAIRGADTTGRFDVQMGPERFLRRDLYVVASGARGGTQVRGTVVTTLGGKPIPNAIITLSSGSRAQADERGEFAIFDATAGTQMLDVRALGFYPERRPIDIVPDGPAVRVVMSTLQAVLDTVRIVAKGVMNMHLKGFEERRITGAGHYITDKDIVRLRAFATTEIIKRIPGLKIQRTGNPGDPTEILMRGTFEDQCKPEFFLDNRYLGQLGPEDLDAFVRPGNIAGIEAYAGSMAPAEFNLGMGSAHCGVIVIWTK